MASTIKTILTPNTQLIILVLASATRSTTPVMALIQNPKGNQRSQFSGPAS